MEVDLISQIQFSANDKTLAEVIIGILEEKNYTCLKALVAFANYGGISGLSQELDKSSISERQIIVGIDNRITSVEALDELIRLGFSCKVSHNSSSFIFHPKLYLFENIDKYCLIVGSGNLTTGGLVYNDECYVRMAGDKTDSIYQQVNNLIEQLWNSDSDNIKLVDEYLINELYSAKLIVSESEVKSNSEDIYDGIFKKVNARQLPIGFNPQKTEKVKIGKLIRLLPHNQKIYNQIEAQLQNNSKGYIVQPTGTGKSYLIAKYIQDHIEEKLILVAPNKIILDSVREITGKLPAHITFQTYQYLSKDLNRTKNIANGIKHILIDEFHHAGASTWSKAINELIVYADNPYVLGFSATPERDNDDIDVASMFFDNNCIHSLSLFECWDKKILPMPKLVQSFIEIDIMLSRIEDELIQKNSTHKSTVKRIQKQIQDIKSKYISIASLETVIKDFIPQNTTKAIVFVPSIDSIPSQMEILSNCFRNLGFTPSCFQVHSKQNDKENKRQLEEYKSKDTGINLMFSVDKLIEGIHVEDVDALLLLRSTESVRIALQQLGRCLSSGKKTTPVVLDLVNNYKAGNIFGMSISTNGICSDVQSEAIAKQLNVLGNYAEIKQAISDLYSKFNSWEENFELLLDVKNKLGREPKGSDNVVNVFNWWRSQKAEYRNGKMSQEHIDKFIDNGFVLEQWDYMLEQLKKFKEDNNRLPTQKDGKIGIWKNSQRQSYRNGTLSNTRASKLLSIDVDLKIKKEWGEWYETLKKFLKENNREPSSNKSKEEKALYSWLVRQRQDYKAGKLEKYKINAFEKINVSLDFSFNEIEEERRFNAKLKEVTDFFKEYNRLPKISENRELYNWINEEKRKMRDGNLKPDRIKKLNEISIVIETYEDWMTKYKKLKSYVDEHGHAPSENDDLELFEWLRKQAFEMHKINNNKSCLNEMQITLLKELNIPALNFQEKSC